MRIDFRKGVFLRKILDFFDTSYWTYHLACMGIHMLFSNIQWVAFLLALLSSGVPLSAAAYQKINTTSEWSIPVETLDDLSEAVFDDDTTLTYSLPVNAASTPRWHLVVSPPEGFYTLSDYVQGILKNGLIEFIPEGESFDDWSKIFMVSLFLGKGLSADKVTSSFQKMIEGMGVNKMTLIQKDGKKEKDYSWSRLVTQYETINGQVEMVYIEFYSGPFDCSGIQYVQKLDRWLNKKEAEHQARVIQEMMENSRFMLSDDILEKQAAKEPNKNLYQPADR